MQDFHATSMQVKDFDLRHTFESAQPLTFHADYNPALNSLIYASGKNLISVMHVGGTGSGKVMVVSEDLGFASNEVIRRFRLNDNMRSIYKKINTDQFIAESIKRYRGMRLTLNDPWETTVCFIISQFNNVKRIRSIIKNMVARFGEPILDGDNKIIGRAFPSSEILRNASIKELMKCGTGFRARYIKSAAEYCTDNLDLYGLNQNDYYGLKEALMEIDGVGDKVADCIILMGYGNLNAFPVDVWVKRTIEKVYFKGKKKKIKEIHKFAEDMWQNWRGYTQQYLFWHFRQMKNDERRVYEGIKQRY